MSLDDLPGSWQPLDWRFLLPSARLGSVWVAADRTAEAAALRSLGEQLVDTSVGDTTQVDTVVASGHGVDLAAARARLRPGGLLALTVTGPPPGAPRSARLRPWAAWRAHLAAHGFETVVAASAVPTLGRISALVDVREGLALRVALRRHAARPVSRLLGRAVATAAAAGLGAAVCPQGVVLARLAGEPS